MGKVVIGRVKGSMWYNGTKITGVDTTPTVFPQSEVEYAYIGDMYFNAYTGNTYTCTKSGEPNVAEWSYQTNLHNLHGIEIMWEGDRPILIWNSDYVFDEGDVEAVTEEEYDEIIDEVFEDVDEEEQDG